jgi:TonB family protein
MLCTELAKQQGEILIEKVDAAKRYTALAGPLEEYKGDWKKTDDSAGPEGQSVGVFYFVDGKFRLNGSFHDVQVSSASEVGPLLPGKLTNRVQPVYPESARQLRIQGAVSVNVIVQKDVSETVENVGAGNPMLAPAAVAAVQQWHYHPTTVNGEQRKFL